MILFVRNVQYFEWEVPNDLLELTISHQGLIDEYFNPDDPSVDHVSDDYYELESVEVTTWDMKS